MAQALHTELILPEHHEVANAVGAIAGSVMVEEELLIYPQLSRDGLEVFGYYRPGPATSATSSKSWTTRWPTPAR